MLVTNKIMHSLCKFLKLACLYATVYMHIILEFQYRSISIKVFNF